MSFSAMRPLPWAVAALTCLWGEDRVRIDQAGLVTSLRTGMPDYIRFGQTTAVKNKLIEEAHTSIVANIAAAFEGLVTLSEPEVLGRLREVTLRPDQRLWESVTPGMIARIIVDEMMKMNVSPSGCDCVDLFLYVRVV